MTRTALITGGQQGIGLGIAAALAGAGFAVALAAEAAEDADPVRTALAALGPGARYYRHDMRDVAAAAGLVERVEADMGPLDTLVSNAGVPAPVRGDMLDVTPESFDLVLGVNLRGGYFLACEVARRMAARRAEGFRSMVFVTSVSAAMVSVERAEYCISKAGASMMTALFAARLAPLGIGIYELRPGIVATAMTAGVRATYDARIPAGLDPAGRRGTPADVAEVALALVEGRLAFATGAVIPVDGGLSIPRLLAERWPGRKAERYAFVIVGGGPAGCVLARRLVDAGNASVLLLEAGPADRHPLIHIPAGFTKLTGPGLSWGYETVPQVGLGGKRVWYPQARVLGGGSSINAQLYTRGNAWDYDNWAAHGCDGWSYAEVLPYFRRAEDNSRYVDAFHGQDGPLRVSDLIPHRLTQAFVRAAQQAGMPFNLDFNGAEQAGLGFYQVTNRDGRRSSAPVCYLRPILKNPAFALRTGAHVERIEVKGDRAVAVHVGGWRIEAGREVLLTAGAIGSPRVLMHSGIGPAGDLRAVGVAPVLDHPCVGANLQDHMDLFVVTECNGPHSFDRYKPLHMTAAAGLQWLMFGTGILASNICDGGGFWYADEAAPAPDIQFHFLPGSGLEHGLAPVGNGVTLNSAFLRPRSRGTVRLASNDPRAKPLIDPNYWGDPYDVRISIAGFRLARRIMAQPALRAFTGAEAHPGAAAVSDEDIRAYACRHAKTDYHPVGTCKMGAEDDPSAVVTPRLRLKGIESLRVCDSSVMPFVNSSNTNAPTIMIAEKAADMIRAEQGL